MSAEANPPPRATTRIERLQQLAAAGRPEAILQDLLADREFGYPEPGLALDHMEQALQVAADAGCERLIEIAFREALRSSLGYLLRTEYLAGRCLKEWDHANTSLDYLQVLNDQVLPSLERLQNHVVQLSKAYAGIRRNLGLAAQAQEEDPAKCVGNPVEPAPVPEPSAEAVLRYQEAQVA